MLDVWLPHASEGAFEVALREALPPTVRLVGGASRPDPADYAVLVKGRPVAEDLDRAPHLAAVVIPFAGLPPATRDLLRARPALQVFNLHHNAAPTAEMAVGLLLAAARRLVPCDQALRRGDWRPRYATDRGLLLDGARAVVLGYGAIGRRVAVALRALGMDVDAMRRGGKGGEAAEGVRVWPVARLDERLDGAHVLVLAVPLTDATRELIDGPRLDRLAPGAILVNVARGAVLDEEALFARLRDGRLGGAGLDVWWRYPSDADSREATAPSALDFGALENVVLSPHRAGHVDATEGLRARHLARVLAALASGDVPPGRVDLDAGY